MRLLVGEPDGLSCAATQQHRPTYPDSDIADVSAVTLRFRSGAVAAISATCILAGPHAIGLTLLCEGMAVEVTESELRVTTAAGTQVTPARVDPFLAEDAAFLRAVRGHEDPNGGCVPYGEALATHRLTTAAAHGG